MVYISLEQDFRSSKPFRNLKSKSSSIFSMSIVQASSTCKVFMSLTYISLRLDPNEKSCLFHARILFKQNSHVLEIYFLCR